MISPEKTKDFIQDLQVYVVKVIQTEFPSVELAEALDAANQIVNYSFNLMLKTHKKETDDDIPF